MSAEQPEREAQSETAPVVVPAVTVTPAQLPVEKKPASVRAKETAGRWYRIARLVILVALSFIAAIFIVLNSDDVTVDLISGETEIPLSFVMILFLVIGLVLGWLLHWFSARRRR